MSLLAIWGVERPRPAPVHGERGQSFAVAVAEIWADPHARRFTVFVFLSMLAYSAQDLILEPFAGLRFGLTPGQSTSLSGIQHGGVLAGMLLVGIGGNAFSKDAGWMRGWTVAGCIGSAAALAGLACAARFGGDWPLRVNVAALGFANGIFAVAAIGSMMSLAGADGPGREGVRMGVWGRGAGGGVRHRRVPRRGRGRCAAGADRRRAGVVRGGVRNGSRIVHRRGGAGDADRDGGTATSGRPCGSRDMSETFDAVVIGGGPSGATAATTLARAGHKVLLLDRAGAHQAVRRRGAAGGDPRLRHPRPLDRRQVEPGRG